MSPKGQWSVIISMIHPHTNQDIGKIENEGLTITNTEETANTFNSYFATAGSRLVAQIDSDGVQRIDTYIDCSLYCYPTTEEEISLIIRNLKNSAAGCDEISAKIVITIHLEIAKLISYLVNLSFKCGQFPQALKEAVITPIHKGKSKLNVSNYRSFSVLTVLSKVFEKAMYNCLYSHFDSCQLFCND